MREKRGGKRKKRKEGRKGGREKTRNVLFCRYSEVLSS